MDIIVDIDGTLANVEHRLHHIQGEGKKDWDAFFADCANDAPIMPVCVLVRALMMTNHTIIFCTGRPAKWRRVTTEWLFRHVAPPNRLFMRADNDHRPDTVIKQEMLERMRNAGLNPILAIDDRKDVVAMWRANGIICAQVAEGLY